MFIMTIKIDVYSHFPKLGLNIIFNNKKSASTNLLNSVNNFYKRYLIYLSFNFSYLFSKKFQVYSGVFQEILR